VIVQVQDQAQGDLMKTFAKELLQEEERTDLPKGWREGVFLIL
jgi:hypothetical protein